MLMVEFILTTTNYLTTNSKIATAKIYQRWIISGWLLLCVDLFNSYIAKLQLIDCLVCLNCFDNYIIGWLKKCNRQNQLEMNNFFFVVNWAFDGGWVCHNCSAYYSLFSFYLFLKSNNFLKYNNIYFYFVIYFIF